MKHDCDACRRLERMLEQAAIRRFEELQQVSSLAESNPNEALAKMALARATEAKDEAQRLFNEHVAQHARDDGH